MGVTPFAGTSAAIVHAVGGGDLMSSIVAGILAAAVAFALTWIVAFLLKLLKAPADQYFLEKERAAELAEQLRSLAKTKRDTWLADAVHYLVMGRWPEPGEGLFEACSPEEGALAYLNRQKATILFGQLSSILLKMFQSSIDGELVFWGIPKARSEMNVHLEVKSDAMFVCIQGEHWKAGYRIDPEQFIYFPHESIFTSKRGAPSTLDGESYCALMVSRRQINTLAKQWSKELK
jgi:hypothetical protein